MSMSAWSRTRSTVFVFIWVMLLAASSGAQECKEKAMTIAPADVYADVPQYVTGRGWQGSVFARLAKDTQLYVCDRRNVGYGIGSAAWCRIIFLEGKTWKAGWVMEETVKDWVPGAKQAPQRQHAPQNKPTPHGKPATQGTHSFLLVSEAYADTAAGDPAAARWDLATPPPLDKIKETPPTAATLKTETSTSIAQSAKLYWPLFGAMLLGMAAKAGVDLLYASSGALKKEHLRNGMVAFLISPMVFLGIMTSGEFKASGQTFFVLCLFAFQNGFFWQTLLKRPVTPDGKGAEQRPATRSTPAASGQ